MSESTEAIVRALGLPVMESGMAGRDARPTERGRAGRDGSRLAVLEDLRRGRISPEDALLRLRQHGEKGERR